MSFTYVEVPHGFGCDANLAFVDSTLRSVLPFPQVNGGDLKWGAARASASADGSVSLRMAVFTFNGGWRVSKIHVTNGNPVQIPLQNGDCRISVCRVNEPGSDPNIPVTIEVESLLAPA